MSNLAHRQAKIQAKRKTTPWRDFVMEICSRCPIVFYKQKSGISKFPPLGKNIIVNQQTFLQQRNNLHHNDSWHAGDNIFACITNLFHETPLPVMMHRGENENCDFVDVVLNARNSYLSIGLVTDVENVLYSRSVKDYTKNVLNSVMVWKHCDSIFSSLSVINSFNVFYSKFIDNSANIWFSSNLIGCQECLFCDNLQNQSYCIANKLYTKEAYLIEKTRLLHDKQKFIQYHSQVNMQSVPLASDQVEGNGIIESQQIKDGFFIFNVHGGKNLFLGGSTQGNEDMYDCISFGSPRSKHVYGGYSINFEHVYCSVHSSGSSFIFYSYFMEDCSFCLGCVGLKNKSYCILNKQYTKEERYKKVDEIFAQMDKDGTLGEFFPASMNPFYFNDTAAYLIDPSFTKEEVTSKGYLRRDEPIKVDIPADAKVVQSTELDKFEGRRDDQRTIDPEILKYVIQDEQGNYYRIIPMEYKFLMKHGLPLPRKHRLERMKENFRIN